MLHNNALEGLALTTALAGLVAASSPAHADLAISSEPTRHVSCDLNSTCHATARNAVMNIADLRAMLASENVTLETGGIARNIAINAALRWTSSNTLELKADNSVIVNTSMTIAGTGGLGIQTTGGELAIGPKASVTFWDVASQLKINGIAYGLFSDITTLSDAILKNPSGSYALARNYDASVDGVYPVPPIWTDFGGNFEGLGHAISNLTIDTNFPEFGFFQEIDSTAKVSNFRLLHASVSGESGNAGGILAAGNGGIIDHVFASGTVDGVVFVGGLVGSNSGTISNSHVFVEVRSTYTLGVAGGVTALNIGTISTSYAEGGVQAEPFSASAAGGVAGSNGGSIENSYSLAKVSPGEFEPPNGGYYGGLMGYRYNGNYGGKVFASYAAGEMSNSKRKGGTDGGAVGFQALDGDSGGEDMSETCWDLDMGVSDPAQGAGDIRNYPGIAGLTTQQLQSGLPKGFSPKIWGQDPAINSGFPYLLSNPPN